MPYRQRISGSGEKVAPRRRHEAIGPVDAQQNVQPLRDVEALFGNADRRLEQLRPRQLAVPLVHVLEQANEARHADAESRQHRLVERHRLAFDEKAVGMRRGRRRLATVIDLQLRIRLVPVEDESAAADAARLRLDEVEDELCRDRRIDGRAAGAQHLAPRFGSESVGGRHHVALGRRQLVRLRPRRSLGLAARVEQLRIGGNGERQQQDVAQRDGANLRGSMGTGRDGELFTNFRHHAAEHNGCWKGTPHGKPQSVRLAAGRGAARLRAAGCRASSAA